MHAAPLGGLEPPAFRLTAERASQLRHRGCTIDGTVDRHITIAIERNRHFEQSYSES